MTKNKGKGGKNRRRGKNDSEFIKQELILAEEGQVYGQVLKMLGNIRVDVYCFDGTRRLCHIRGKMRKKVWVNAGDIVLVSLREFQNDKADIIHKYTQDEARQLKALQHLPENAKLNEMDVGGGDSGEEDDIEFQDKNSEDGESDHSVNLAAI